MAEQLSLDLPLPHPPLPELRQLWTPDDIFGALDAELLQQFSEDRRLERKSAKIDPRAVSDYFSMWANSAPDGGVILIALRKMAKFLAALC